MTIATSVNRRGSETRYVSDPIEGLYRQHCQSGSAMAPHLPMLRTLAAGAAVAVECGVKRGGSTCALLLGAQHVISYDVLRTPEATHLAALAGARWAYRIADSRTAPPTAGDLLLLDSLHTYDQVRAELAQHGSVTRKLIIVHDVTTFGEVAAAGETGCQAWLYRAGMGSVPREAWGIRPALDEWQIAHPEWQLAYRSVESHGLLVLERRG